MFGRIATLTAEGRTRDQIMLRLGLSRMQMNNRLAKPAKYVKGHQWSNTATRLGTILRRRQRTAELQSVRAMGYVRWQSEKPADPRAYHRRQRETQIKEAKQAILVQALRAFDLGSLAGATSPRYNPLVYIAPQQVRLTLEQTRRVLKERDQSEMDHLRGLVRLGWNQDRPAMDRRLVYLEDLARAHFDKSDYLSVLGVTQAVDPEDLLAYRVAGRLLEAGPDTDVGGLLHRVMHEPETLTVEETTALRAIYGQTENAVLRGETIAFGGSRSTPITSAVDGGGGFKRGRGTGRHRGTTRTKAGRHGQLSGGRHEGQQQIRDERAIRLLRRESRAASLSNDSGSNE